MSKYNLTDLAEGMGYKEYEDAEEANRLEKHPERDTIKKIQALMAKEKSLEEDAVDLAVEASQAKAGIKEDEDEDRKNDEDYEDGWIDSLEETDEYLDELDEDAMQPGEADLESGQTGNMDAYTEDIKEDDYTDRKGKALYPILKDKANATGDEVELYVQSLAKDIELNGKEQYREFTSDDFVEDFKEFIGNKSLKEHFNRFK